MKHYEKWIPVINKGFAELNPLQAGEEMCRPLHSYGPAIRSYYLIHYVVSGKGVLEKNGERFAVTKGNAFLIRPDELCVYTADEHDPWHYIWVGFDGKLASQFDGIEDIFAAPEKLFEEIALADSYGNCMSEYLASKLFALYTALFAEKQSKKDYVEQVSDYISSNYAADITVSGIASVIGVDRTYLSKLFADKIGMSIQEYLITTRISHAEEFLKSGYMVYEAAAMCGYPDVSNFSRMYKRKKGISPVEARIKKPRN